MSCARGLAWFRVQQQQNKPFLRKPYLKYGQCLGIWSYFFQLGGILGAKHCANPDAFGHAFLGAHGPSGAMRGVFEGIAHRLTAKFPSDSMMFLDYVLADFTERAGYACDLGVFVLEHALKKMSPRVAMARARGYAATDSLPLIKGAGRHPGRAQGLHLTGPTRVLPELHYPASLLPAELCAFRKIWPHSSGYSGHHL